MRITTEDRHTAALLATSPALAAAIARGELDTHDSVWIVAQHREHAVRHGIAMTLELLSSKLASQHNLSVQEIRKSFGEVTLDDVLLHASNLTVEHSSALSLAPSPAVDEFDRFTGA